MVTAIASWPKNQLPPQKSVAGMVSRVVADLTAGLPTVGSRELKWAQDMIYNIITTLSLILTSIPPPPPRATPASARTRVWEREPARRQLPGHGTGLRPRPPRGPTFEHLPRGRARMQPRAGRAGVVTSVSVVTRACVVRVSRRSRVVGVSGHVSVVGRARVVERSRVVSVPGHVSVAGIVTRARVGTRPRVGTCARVVGVSTRAGVVAPRWRRSRDLTLRVDRRKGMAAW